MKHVVKITGAHWYEAADKPDTTNVLKYECEAHCETCGWSEPATDHQVKVVLAARTHALENIE